MPVLAFSTKRLQEFLLQVKLDKILEAIPFIGLDIEGIDSENVRIEYNPNRPDFSSQYGIVRALKGLLEIEVGIPNFQLSASNRYVIKVDESIKLLRPYIVSLVATRKQHLTDEEIRELITMQEDLHNGIGRHRKKASIGMHDLDKIQFPLSYTSVDKSFSFVPLDKEDNYTIEQILDKLDTGLEYGYIVKDRERYPIVVDSNNTVLSFPPIVNSNATKISTDVKSIVVEITANNKRTAQDTIAIIAMNLFDAGFKIQPVTIYDSITGNKELTPFMEPKTVQVDSNYINQVLGLNLDTQEISFCLQKSRLGIAHGRAENGGIICIVPRYRTDIFHQIDIVEEVAIGYGIFNLQPTVPWSKASGERSDLTWLFNAVREILTGLGMLEILSLSLVSKKVQYELTGLKDNIKQTISVNETKSAEYEVLRESLVPSLLHTLSHNIHEVYPQKLFEIGKVFGLSDCMNEHWN
ncbi:MAG TPA: phenylalanine--tRNA ligase subunit beta, partial [Nitrososphaeraceae archaeon]|nr:phenylalanine--tRNA ligase subunit beta [Nitrososphaeraceae archaeon]